MRKSLVVRIIPVCCHCKVIALAIHEGRLPDEILVYDKLPLYTVIRAQLLYDGNGDPKGRIKYEICNLLSSAERPRRLAAAPC